MLFTLFFTSFLSATILPLPSEGIVLYMLHAGFDHWTVFMIATSGNVLGGATTYYLGRAGHAVSAMKKHKIREKVKKYGSVMAVLAWVPVVGDVILLVCGFLKCQAIPTLIWMFAGKALRYAVIIYLIT